MPERFHIGDAIILIEFVSPVDGYMGEVIAPKGDGSNAHWPFDQLYPPAWIRRTGVDAEDPELMAEMAQAAVIFGSMEEPAIEEATMDALLPDGTYVVEESEKKYLNPDDDDWEDEEDTAVEEHPLPPLSDEEAWRELYRRSYEERENPALTLPSKFDDVVMDIYMDDPSYLVGVIKMDGYALPEGRAMVLKPKDLLFLVEDRSGPERGELRRLYNELALYLRKKI